MRPTIVLATDSREPSGLGAHMITLGQTLSDRFHIVVACQHDAAGMAFLGRAARAGLRIKAFDPERLDVFRAWLGASDIALLHVHAGIGWEGHDLVRYGKAAGVPVVRTEHLPYLLTSVVQQAEYRAMLKSVDCRIAVSEAAFASNAERGDGLHAVVCNGIVPGQAAQSSSVTRSAIDLATGDTMVLTVARFTAQKGHDVLVAAAPEVLRQRPEVKFVLVGEGPEREAIQASIAAAQLEDSIVLLGQRDDVPDLMAMADLFVLPSNFEGLPLAILEAMATGLPIVATAIGGTIEAIGADHPFLVPPADAGALASAVLRALAEPASAQAAAVGAQARFQNRFTAARMGDETAKVYAPLLQLFPQGYSA